jgi:hypothetical protein
MIVGPIGSTMTNDRSFTPALGRADLTSDYDRVIAVMTRERRWRSALLKEIALAAGEVIVDVGCGTGTFAVMLAKAQPAARVIAVDPDEAVLEIARAKAQAEDVDVDWRLAMGDELVGCLGRDSSLGRDVQPRPAPVPTAHEGGDPDEHARDPGRQREVGAGRLRRAADAVDAPAVPAGSAPGRFREHLLRTRVEPFPASSPTQASPPSRSSAAYQPRRARSPCSERRTRGIESIAEP